MEDKESSEKEMEEKER
jgi:hypothetical protein